MDDLLPTVAQGGHEVILLASDFVAALLFTPEPLTKALTTMSEIIYHYTYTSDLKSLSDQELFHELLANAAPRACGRPRPDHDDILSESAPMAFMRKEISLISPDTTTLVEDPSQILIYRTSFTEARMGGWEEISTRTVTIDNLILRPEGKDMLIWWEYNQCMNPCYINGFAYRDDFLNTLRAIINDIAPGISHEITDIVCKHFDLTEQQLVTEQVSTLMETVKQQVPGARSNLYSHLYSSKALGQLLFTTEHYTKRLGRVILKANPAIINWYSMFARFVDENILVEQIEKTITEIPSHQFVPPIGVMTAHAADQLFSLLPPEVMRRLVKESMTSAMPVMGDTANVINDKCLNSEDSGWAHVEQMIAQTRQKDIRSFHDLEQLIISCPDGTFHTYPLARRSRELEELVCLMHQEGVSQGWIDEHLDIPTFLTAEEGSEEQRRAYDALDHFVTQREHKRAIAEREEIRRREEENARRTEVLHGCEQMLEDLDLHGHTLEIARSKETLSDWTAKMRNCIHTYDYRLGMDLLFALSKGGEMVLNAQLIVNQDGMPQVTQFLGKRNSRVNDPDLLDVAEQMRHRGIQVPR